MIRDELFVFDLDGTVLRSNEVDERAYLMAARETFASLDDISTDWSDYPDATDTVIFDALATQAGVPEELRGMTERRFRYRFGAILDEDRFPMVFGGEHSVTPGAIRPFLERYPDLAVLHFDAHADLRDGYEGEHFSHASAIRRVMDHPDVEVVSVGIRNISAGEIPFLEANRHRLHIHWAKDKALWTLQDILAPLRDRPVYLTFDLDGFDASLMPATGTPEPGGLMWDDAIAVIRAAADVCSIVGADVNELAPREHLHGCDFLAAKLAYKILSYAHCGTPRFKGARPSNLSLH